MRYAAGGSHLHQAPGLVPPSTCPPSTCPLRAGTYPGRNERNWIAEIKELGHQPTDRHGPNPAQASRVRPAVLQGRALIDCVHCLLRTSSHPGRNVTSLLTDVFGERVVFYSFSSSCPSLRSPLFPFPSFQWIRMVFGLGGRGGGAGVGSNPQLEMATAEVRPILFSLFFPVLSPPPSLFLSHPLPSLPSLYNSPALVPLWDIALVHHACAGQHTHGGMPN